MHFLWNEIVWRMVPILFNVSQQRNGWELIQQSVSLGIGQGVGVKSCDALEESFSRAETGHVPSGTTAKSTLFQPDPDFYPPR